MGGGRESQALIIFQCVPDNCNVQPSVRIPEYSGWSHFPLF